MARKTCRNLYIIYHKLQYLHATIWFRLINLKMIGSIFTKLSKFFTDKIYFFLYHITDFVNLQ